jgi:hypothetical protein
MLEVVVGMLEVCQRIRGSLVELVVLVLGVTEQEDLLVEHHLQQLPGL